MSDLISKRFIQGALLEKISKLNAEGEVKTARELIRFKKLVDGMTAADRPTVDKEYLIDLVQEAVYDGEACAKLMDLVDRPTGEWVHKANGNIECSLCGRERQIGWINFCGGCGARMEVKEE